MTFSRIEIERRCCHEGLCISTVPMPVIAGHSLLFARISLLEFNGEVMRIWMNLKNELILCEQMN